MKKRRNLSGPVLRRLVEERAGFRCEYCHAPQPVCGYRFHLDHVVPESLGGSKKPANRALACAACNLAKLDRDGAIDPKTGEEAALFNPRTDRWSDHFRWSGSKLMGRSATGRATIVALGMNRPAIVAIRQALIELGRSMQD